MVSLGKRDGNSRIECVRLLLTALKIGCQWMSSFFSVDRGRHVSINQMLMPKAADQLTHTYTQLCTCIRTCTHTHTQPRTQGQWPNARATNTVTEKCNAQKRKNKKNKRTTQKKWERSSREYMIMKYCVQPFQLLLYNTIHQEVQYRHQI